jgi:hypothetical protein
MHNRIFSSLVLILGVLGALIGASTSVLFGIGYWQTLQTSKSEGLVYTLAQSNAVADYVDKEMLGQKELVDRLAARLETASIARSDIPPLLEAAIQEKPNLFGIAVAFQPGAYPGLQRYAPYYHLLNTGTFGISQVEASYDYTNEEEPAAIWYTETAKSQQGRFYIYYGKVSDDWIILYAEPFYRIDPVSKERVFYGVVAAAHTLNTTFRQFFQYVPLGEEGYAALLTDSGKLAYHPRSEFVGKTIFQVADILKDPDLAYAGTLLNSQSVFTVDRVTASGYLTWTTFRQLPTSNWYVSVSIRQDVMAIPSIENIRLLANLGLSILLAIDSLAIIIFMKRLTEPAGIWGIAIMFGVCSLIGIAWIWYLIYTNPLEQGSRNAITNQQAIQTALAPIETSELALIRGKPTRVPTGVIVETISVTNRTASLTGYVWQNYPLDTPAEMTTPPQFVNETEEASFREVYRFVRNGKQVVGWFFTTELSENFDVSRYPLDEITARLEIEPRDLAGSFVLVPDIDSYGLLSPSYKPGLSPEVAIPGWNIRSAYFSLENIHYATNFGGMINVKKNQYPTLIYNIHAARSIISPLIAYCIIIFVLLVQVFGVVMIRIKERMQVLSVGATLFLVNAVAHNGLRSELVASSMVYLEYYFILLYVTILASSINGLVRTMKLKLKVVESQENLLAKALFWPLYLGIGFLITLAVFYPR